MSAMDDIHSTLPPTYAPSGKFNAGGGLLLSIVLALLFASSLFVIERSESETGTSPPAVSGEEIDWKGNSGGPRRGPY